ncbi:MAG TPA: carbohydrate kinase, partial [Deinococcales bacterium]|nr:carbohydrate kinase [Deinococcales bacterium]
MNPLPSPDLIVFGEALIDFKSTGGLGFQGFVGGSPLNVALAAARLGRPSALATRLSTDLFGEAILAHLTGNGVHLGLLERGPEPTTLAFVQTVNGDARYSFRNEGAADTRYDPPAASLPETVRAVHLGSVALLSEPGASAITRLARAQAEQALVHFDPNVRPSLVTGRAAYLRRISEVLAFTGWLKLSSEDLEWLAPGEAEAQAAGRWLQAGPAVVVVTRGKDGSALSRKDEPPLECPGLKVSVVDTVGAGDTF